MGHHNDYLVIDGVRHGFLLQYNGPPRFGEPARYKNGLEMAATR